jgi:hypothetical protein
LRRWAEPSRLLSCHRLTSPPVGPARPRFCRGAEGPAGGPAATKKKERIKTKLKKKVSR